MKMLNLGTVLQAVLYTDDSQTYVLGFDLSPKTNYTCKYNSLTFIFRRLIDIFGLIWPKKNSSLLKCLTQEKKKKKKKKFLLRLQHANLPAAPTSAQGHYKPRNPRSLSLTSSTPPAALLAPFPRHVPSLSLSTSVSIMPVPFTVSLSPGPLQ